jgi:hypothetical protein
MFVFRPFCITHSFVVAGENAPCGAGRTRTRAGNVPSLTSEPTHRWSLVGCSAPRSSIREVDAVLAGGRATATTNSCTGNRDKATRGKRSQFLELIGSVAVAVPADYTRYMNQPVFIWGKWEKLSSKAGSCHKSEMVDPSPRTITCSPLVNASIFPFFGDRNGQK